MKISSPYLKSILIYLLASCIIFIILLRPSLVFYCWFVYFEYWKISFLSLLLMRFGCKLYGRKTFWRLLILIGLCCVSFFVLLELFLVVLVVVGIVLVLIVLFASCFQAFYAFFLQIIVQIWFILYRIFAYKLRFFHLNFLICHKIHCDVVFF